MKRLGKIILTLLLLVTSVNISAQETTSEEPVVQEIAETVVSEVATETLFDNEGITIKMTKSYQEETNTVDAEVFVEIADGDLATVEMQDANGNSLEDKKTETGSYVFGYGQNASYDYQLSVTKDDVTTTSPFTVSVDEITVYGANDTTNGNKTTRAAESALGVSIAGLYEASVDAWQLESSTAFDYTVSVTSTFSDTATDKRIRITMPEGIRFKKYQVETPDKSGVQTTMVESSFKDFFQATTSTPQKQENYASYNVGALEYQYKPGTESVVTLFDFEVDTMVYYGPKNFTEGIKIELIEDGVVKNTSIKSISALTTLQYNWASSGAGPTQTVVAGNENYTPATAMVLYIQSGPAGAGSYNKYIKEVKIKDYYPKELELSDSYQIGQNFITEINKEEGSIARVIPNTINTGNGYYRTLDISLSPKNMNESQLGLYIASRGPEIQVTMYDGTIISTEDRSISTAYPSGGVIRYNVVSATDPAAANMLKFSTGTKSTIEYANISDRYEVSVFNFGSIEASTTAKTNQTFEYEISPDFLATRIAFYQGNGNEQLGTVYYRTNKDSTLRTIEPGNPAIKQDGNLPYGVWYILREDLGFAEDEYFTYARAYVGTFEPGFKSNASAGSIRAFNGLIVGRLSESASIATVTIRTFASTDEGATIEQGSENSKEFSVVRISDADVTLSAKADSYEKTVIAGESVTLNFDLSVNYLYRNTGGFVNPKFCFAAPQNTSVKTSSISAKDESNVSVNVSDINKQIVDDKEITCMTVEGEVGHIFSYKSKSIKLTFDLETGIQAGGSYSQESLAWWLTDVGKLDYSTYGYPSVSRDTNDIDADGDTSENLLPVNSRSLSIQRKTGVLVDTAIQVQGGSKEPAFDLANSTTAVKFTPGTTAEYNVDIINNTTAAANAVRVYLPVPKTGGNFGTNFQSEAFKWDMKISGNANVKLYNADGTENTVGAGNIIVEYSSDATEANYESGATWTTTPTDSTNMIRVRNADSTNLQPGEKITISMAYIVDENDASVTANPEKLNAVQDFRPYYYYSVTGQAAGYAEGTRAGVELVIGKIAGRVFEDVNFDGVYNTGDTVLAGKDVTLYQLVGGRYTSVMITTTISDGTYTFEGLANGIYKVDFNAVPTVEQSFAKKDVGSDETVDSDVVLTGTDAGYAINVDPVDDSSNNVDAGIINYNPASLSVTINEGEQTLVAWNPTLQTGERVVLTSTIAPTNFDEIKASRNSIVWSSSNPSVVSVANGGIQGNAPGSALVSVTITDMFGNTATHSVEVTITSNTAPTIATSSTAVLTHELGVEYTTDLKTLVTVTDTEDNPIVDTRLVATGSVDANTIGTYTIDYVYTDADGNTATHSVDVAVVDTTVPVILDTESMGFVSVVYGSTITEESILIALGEVIVTELSEYSLAITGFENLDQSIVGQQTVGLIATDIHGNVSEVFEITVWIADMEIPTLAVENTTVEHAVGTELTEETFKALLGEIVMADNYTPVEDLVLTIETLDSVDVDTLGNYIVEIYSVDSSFNDSERIQITVRVVDKVAPEITVANTTVIHEVNTGLTQETLVELLGEVTLSDNYYTTGLEMTMVGFDTVDTTTVGEYTVNVYTVDGSLNQSASVAITVNIVDTTAPIVEVATNPARFEVTETINADTIYERIGVTITDSSATSWEITGVDLLDLTAVGTDQTVVLVVTDDYGNETIVNITIQLESALEVNSTTNLILFEIGESITEAEIIERAGIFATDGRELISSISAEMMSMIDDSAIGQWEIEIIVRDNFGGEQTINVLVMMEDHVAPVVSVENTAIRVSYQNVTEDAILAAIGRITIEDESTTEVVFEGIADLDETNLTSAQEIYYVVTDAGGNETRVSIQVTVIDDINPVVSIENTSITVELGETVTPALLLEKLGAVTIDDVSTTVTSIEGNVDASLLGVSQTVNAIVTDAHGNVTSTPITVVVEDTTAPEMEILQTSVSYSDDVIITEAQFLQDVVGAITDNDPTAVLTPVSNFDTVVNFGIPGIYTVEIRVTDAQGNTILETVTVEITSSTKYFIEASDFAMTVDQYNAAVASGTVEETILESAGVRAWGEHSRHGIIELDVEVSSVTIIPDVVNHGEEITVTVIGGQSSVPGFLRHLIGPRAIETPLVETTLVLSITNNTYTVNFYDCEGSLVSQDWALQGNDAKPNSVYSYPTVSYTNVKNNSDAYPVNCSNGFVIPNTGK